jgi:hypothetical protein
MAITAGFLDPTPSTPILSGTPNQVVGLTAAATATEYKTLSSTGGITISHAPAAINFALNTVSVSSLASVAQLITALGAGGIIRVT